MFRLTLKNCIFYIDPQSYNNLAAYDYNLLSNMNREIRFYGSKYYDAPQMPENIIFSPVFRYNMMHNNLLKTLSYLMSYAVIVSHVLRFRPKTIHVQWLKIEKLDYIVYSLLSLMGIRIVFTAHNVLPHNTGERHAGIYKKIFTMVDDIIVHTSDTKNKITNRFHIPGDKIHIVNHGLLSLNINKEEYEKQKTKLEREYDFNGKTTFTSLGEQSRYKGIDTLVKIWSETPELYNNPNIQLIMAGKIKGLDVSSLQKLSNVFIKDSRISDEEFFHLLTHTDVYLLPYREISQSGAMLTAMTYHIPVLVTKKGGLADPQSVAKVGWSINDCNYDLLKNILIRLSQNKEDIQRVKNNNIAWEKIEKAYSWNDIAQKTSTLYDMNNRKK